MLVRLLAHNTCVAIVVVLYHISVYAFGLCLKVIFILVGMLWAEDIVNINMG